MVQLEWNQSILIRERCCNNFTTWKMHLRVVSISSLARLFWSSPSLRRGGESNRRSTKRFETPAERRLRGKSTRIFVHACERLAVCYIFRADTDAATHGRFSAPISGCSNANSGMCLVALIYLKAKGTISGTNNYTIGGP
jgi:hypothetical protein